MGSLLSGSLKLPTATKGPCTTTTWRIGDTFKDFGPAASFPIRCHLLLRGESSWVILHSEINGSPGPFCFEPKVSRR
jgi:hypothetical protein